MEIRYSLSVTRLHGASFYQTYDGDHEWYRNWNSFSEVNGLGDQRMDTLPVN